MTLSHLMSLHVAIFTYFTVKFPYILINKYLHVFWTEEDRTSCYIPLNSLFLSCPPHATHKRRKHHSLNCFSCLFKNIDKNRKKVLIIRTSYNNEQKFFILLKQNINFSPEGLHFSKKPLTFQVFQARFWTTARKVA